MKKSFQYIDLSIPLTNQTQVYPGDPIVSISPVCGIEKDGFSMHSFHFGGHSGTHIDSQSHFVTGGKHINEYPLSQFVGAGMVIDARGVNVIDIDILGNIKIKKDGVVLFWTDYIKKIYFAEDQNSNLRVLPLGSPIATHPPAGEAGKGTPALVL